MENLSRSILVQDLRERTELSKLNNEFGSFSKQSKNSGIGGGLVPVSVTPLINEILNILSKSHELHEKLNQLAEIQLGESDC